MKRNAHLEEWPHKHLEVFFMSLNPSYPGVNRREQKSVHWNSPHLLFQDSHQKYNSCTRVGCCCSDSCGQFLHCLLSLQRPPSFAAIPGPWATAGRGPCGSQQAVPAPARPRPRAGAAQSSVLFLPSLQERGSRAGLRKSFSRDVGLGLRPSIHC